MKIRVMGTAEECRQAQDFYRLLGRQADVKYVSVSEPYANRGSTGLYRVYIDIEYKDGGNLYGDAIESNVSNEIMCRDKT